MKKILCILSVVIIISNIYGCKKKHKTPEDKTPPDTSFGIVTDIDGNEYKTIIIGEQEWFAENLRTSRYNDGEKISYITDNQEWYNSRAGAFSYYDNSIENKLIYGALYNWKAVLSDKLCPEGWKVPDNDDWIQLEGNVDSKFPADHDEWHNWSIKCRGYDVAIKLKSNSYWHNNSNGTNEIGFNATSGGYRNYDGEFYFIDRYASWWTTTYYGGNTYVSRYISYNKNCMVRLSTSVLNGLSVRCVRYINE